MTNRISWRSSTHETSANKTLKQPQKTDGSRNGPDARKQLEYSRHITRQKGVKKGLKLCEGMNSRQTVTTIAQPHRALQPRSLHSPIRPQTSPYCECGQGKETVEQYILEFRKYNEQRSRVPTEKRWTRKNESGEAIRISHANKNRR